MTIRTLTLRIERYLTFEIIELLRALTQPNSEIEIQYSVEMIVFICCRNINENKTHSGTQFSAWLFGTIRRNIEQRIILRTIQHVHIVRSTVDTTLLVRTHHSVANINHDVPWIFSLVGGAHGGFRVCTLIVQHATAVCELEHVAPHASELE